MGWISVGNEVMSAAGRLNYPSLPVNVSGCVPAVHPPPVPTMDPTVLPIYRLSFLYVALFGWLVVMIVGSVVSALTSTELGSSDTIDPNTLTPLVASWVRRRQANKKVASLSMERLDRVSVSTVSVTNLKQS